MAQSEEIDYISEDYEPADQEVLDMLEEFYSYDYTAKQNNKSDFYLSLPHNSISNTDIVQISLSSVLIGLLAGLVCLALINLYERIKSNNSVLPSGLFLFYQLTSVVLLLLVLLSLVEYFLLYDFFFHRNIAWKTHHEWLAYLVDFSKLMQKSLILSFGLHHLISIIHFSCFSPTGGLITRSLLPWTLFAFSSFLLPTSVIILKTQKDLNHLASTIESTFVPFFSGLLLLILILVFGQRRYAKSNLVCKKEEIAATKVVLLYLVIQIACSAWDIFLFEVVPILFQIHAWLVLRILTTLLTNLHLVLFPILYLIYFDDNWKTKQSMKIFPCLNSQNVSETHSINCDPSVIFNEPSEATDSSSTSGSQFVRRLMPGGPVSYSNLRSSNTTDMSHLIDISLENTESERR